MADKTDSQITQPTIPTKLGSVAVVAAFLARYDLFKRTGIPSSKQMELYRRPDDQYFCAVEGCEVCGPSQRGNKTMVAMGPIVICHSHARDVLNDLREGFGKQLDPTETGRTPPRWFHPLNKTLFVIGRKEDESDEEGLAFWHEKTNKEMTGRAQHLAEALAWAPGHREWFARETERKADRVESERQANLPPVPEVNPYIGKTVTQLKKLEIAAADALQVLEENKGDLTEADHAIMKKAYGDTAALVHEAISATEQKQKQKDAEKKSADMLKRLATLNAKLGLTGNMTADGIRVELCIRIPRDAVRVGAKPVKPTATTVRQTTAGTAKGTPAQFLCNCCQQLTGSPNERLGGIPVFVAKQVTTADQARDLLSENGVRYKELLRMHAPDGIKDKELKDRKNPKREEAKRKAKECLLHGSEFKKLGYFLYTVICYAKSKGWMTDQQVENGNGDGDEDEDKPAFTCECGNGVNKLFAKPLSVSEVEVQGKDGKVTGKKIVFKSEMIWDKNTVTGEMQETSLPKLSLCGKCLQAAKSRLTKPIREAKAADKRQCDKALRAKMVNPNEGSGQIGNYKKKHAKKGK